MSCTDRLEVTRSIHIRDCVPSILERVGQFGLRSIGTSKYSTHDIISAKENPFFNGITSFYYDEAETIERRGLKICNTATGFLSVAVSPDNCRAESWSREKASKRREDER